MTYPDRAVTTPTIIGRFWPTFVKCRQCGAILDKKTDRGHTRGNHFRTRDCPCGHSMRILPIAFEVVGADGTSDAVPNRDMRR